MKLHIFSVLLLILTEGSQCIPDSNRFFISAPGVFRVGVKEKVLVQVGTSHLNQDITLYLEHERSGMIVSERKTVSCTKEISTAELMIDGELMSRLSTYPEISRPYLNLVAQIPTISTRKITRVLVSKHKGYIFIQTDQPIYEPLQTVKYRIFTLDRTLRPLDDTIEISIINAAGNRIMKTHKASDGGIYKGVFLIPDLAKMGTWKIKAHYRHDQANAVSVEFKVQKFILPSFEVNIIPRDSYILLGTEQFEFTITAQYSHGEDIAGAYHCQFGVVEKGSSPGKNIKPIYIRELELTGSVKNGTAAASLRIDDLERHLQKQRKQTLSQIQQSGSKIYLGVFVTNIKSGEIQDSEIYIPIASQKYIIDLSRTRSHFLPGYPLDVVARLRHPDGSPAPDVQINVQVSPSQERRVGTTDQEGAMFSVFNIPNTDQITVEVSAEGVQQRKVIQRASSPNNNYLYLSISQKIYSVGDSLIIDFNAINAPANGFIYYMVLSRGSLVQGKSTPIGISVREILQITADMVPSFRLIGYYYDQNGNIIADSVWVDVRDACEINVKVEPRGPFVPGKLSVLDFNLHGQKARVALMAVDKAIYALHADNKLTSKKVFSTMQSSDLGCSYSGGSDPESVLTEAGLSFVTHSQSNWKKSMDCNSQSQRHRRSVNLQQEMMTLKSNFTDEKLQECCVNGFSLIPMKRTCQDRAQRVSLVEENRVCGEVFLKCCLEGERLRQKKLRQDSLKGFGRTTLTEEIEEFFLDTTAQYIRRYFPPSFAFTEFDVDGRKSYTLALPDSITTWEIQVVTLSAATGFCVVEPSEIRAFKNVFVSLRLPYSVRRYEQLALSPVIYNYGERSLQVAVHMEQTEGLCSPGSATTKSFVTITLEPRSSQFVTFSAVPMVTGIIPIKIRLFDIDNSYGIDAVEKTLNVLTEGIEKTTEETRVLNFDVRREDNFIIDGSLPEDSVPDSTSSIFISAEGEGFGSSHAMNLLAPEKVANLIVLPTGCLEQTMVKLAPTASAIRYLDLSDQWFNLPAGKRDEAIDNLEKGYFHILDKKGDDGAYGTWRTAPYSNWMTALVVKVLSMIAERQMMVVGQQGRISRFVPLDDIRHSVGYLLSVQQSDGSFGDANPVLHRGVLADEDRKAAMTAFITVALHKSIPLLENQRAEAEAAISRATAYLQSVLENLNHPYAVAITVYCLAACQPKGTDHSSATEILVALATEGKNGCYLWTTDATQANQEGADALTVDATSYALLAAVELGESKLADKIACWMTTQENYLGGFKSSQDTLNALEALAEYELKRPAFPEARLDAEFTVRGRNDIVQLALDKKGDRVETNLKKFAGNNIIVRLSGKGHIKLKVLKSYHLLEPKSHCNKVSISVTVQGKVKYTPTIIENYEYYGDYGDDGDDEQSETDAPRSAIEWFDARTRNRRDIENNPDDMETITYRVCVSQSQDRNLTGMGIADITLLSGFEVVIQDLDMLKAEPERYISHYEVSHGRVLLYFNQLFGLEECINFDAKQEVPIGLLQPAPAVFYDYYEPDVKCTVFYSAPQRSKKVSTLCSEDVCQCAERPCHKIKNTFQSEGGGPIKKDHRFQHACFSPTVDYAYMVEVINISMKSNFELYKTTVKEVLRSHGDVLANEDSVRVFAKRGQCKGQLALGKQYLVMGKDGSTTDSDGMMQYLLESNTWVERKPLEKECKRSSRKRACDGFIAFTEEYKFHGCRQ